MKRLRLSRPAVAATVLAVAGIATAAWVRDSAGSDHQDTPEVELNPQLDINDVYAFPGSSEDRIVLVMTTQSPITPAGTPAARFDANALYQFKIDNTGDGVEDRVIQFQFDDLTNGAQRVAMFGPVVPATAGPNNRLAKSTPDLVGNVSTPSAVNVITSGSGTSQVQLFAGARDDPFYLDLEQFFRILPDRRPSRGPLALLGPNPSATAFRPLCTNGVPNPGQSQFDPAHGCATDFFRGLNTMAIVVELPESAIKGAGNNVGIWATVGR